MTAALNRRLEKLEKAHCALSRIIVEFPEVEVRFVAAEKSYPQAEYGNNAPVDKSEKPVTVIDLEPGEDLNSVARELGITADELHRQIKSGLVKIIWPPLPDIQPERHPIQVCWPIL